MTRRARAGLLAVLAAALAGCGSAPVPQASEAPRIAQAAGPARDGHATAIRLAARLLALVVLPAGASRLTGPVPAGLRQAASTPGAQQLIDLHRLRVLRQTPSTAEGFLLAHVPAGLRQDGTGYGSGPLQVDFELAAPPPGIYAAGLAEALVAAPGGGSVLRVDAQVIWYPARSAAERLTAASFAAVTVRHSGSGIRTAVRTITGSGQIASLVNLLNGLPAAPGLVLHCPAETSGYQLRFRPAAPGTPVVVVTAGVCATDQVIVGGRTQPALWDPAELLAKAAGRLLTSR